MRTPRRGANAIEFALVLPVLLTFTFGIMDLGWGSLVRHAAGTAAAAGARAGALTPQTDDPSGHAAATANERWAQIGIPATPTIIALQTGDPARMVVRVEVDFQPLIGFVASSHTIDATVTKRMEDQP
jgi:Flp pilus assembly protein TadG